MAEVFNSMEAYRRELQRMAAAIGPEPRRRFLRRIVGETIVELIRASFTAGRDPEGNPWMSPTGGGKFSPNYRVRPSGDAVTADKVRLSDTEQLKGSYKILSSSSEQVTVGPSGQRRGLGGKFATTNKKIAHRAETSWNNVIAGFGRFRERVISLEIDAAWANYARGIPIDRIVKPPIGGLIG